MQNSANQATFRNHELLALRSLGEAAACPAKF
jgi:hypothetical protein